MSQAVYYHLEYHKSNSRQNIQRCVEFVLGKFYDQVREKALASVSEEDILTFLTKLTFWCLSPKVELEVVNESLV